MGNICRKQHKGVIEDVLGCNKGARGEVVRRNKRAQRRRNSILNWKVPS